MFRLLRTLKQQHLLLLLESLEMDKILHRLVGANAGVIDIFYLKLE
jgi:hypothetical protein